MLFWVAPVRHRLSANKIVRCFKLKKLENYMRYLVDFLLHWSYEKYHLILVMARKHYWSISLQNLLFLTCLIFLFYYRVFITTLYLFQEFFNLKQLGVSCFAYKKLHERILSKQFLSIFFLSVLAHWIDWYIFRYVDMSDVFVFLHEEQGKNKLCVVLIQIFFNSVWN